MYQKDETRCDTAVFSALRNKTNIFVSAEEAYIMDDVYSDSKLSLQLTQGLSSKNILQIEYP